MVRASDPAYPRPGTPDPDAGTLHDLPEAGMTIRQRYALAIAAELVGMGDAKKAGPDAVAEAAFRQADAMIEFEQKEQANRGT